MKVNTRARKVDVTVLPASRAVSVLRERLEGLMVLSAYLETSPERTDGPGWLLALRDGCKAVRATLNDPVAEGFETAVHDAEDYFGSAFTPTHPGIAIFTAPYHGAFAVNLPYRPVEGVVWAKGPRIEPLVETLDDFERVAVVLLDKEEARIYTVYLGEIETKRTVKDYVAGRQATGDWFGLSQTRYARRHENQVHRHMNHATEAITELHRTHPFDRLIVGGPDEALAVFRRTLPARLRDRLTGTISLPMFAGDREILAAAQSAAEESERTRELAEVTELLEGIGSHHAAVGLDDVLAALADGRIHQLLLSEAFAAAGARCQVCHRLVPARDRCIWCDAPTVPVSDLREAMIHYALDQGARIDVVHGQAAALLDKQGGIGAWTRY